MKTKEIKTEYKSSTIGMMMNHKHLSKTVLLKVQFYRTNLGNIMLCAVSGHDLSTIKQIKHVIITKEQYNDREYDYYDDTVEFCWAAKLLGFE